MRTRALLILALLPAGCGKERKQAEADTAQATERLKRIGLAMHNHHDTYGAFAAGVYATDNRVGLSWRVQILPFVEQDALYKLFKLDEPWDSDHNKTLLDKMPDVYQTPGVTPAAGHTFVRGFASTVPTPAALFPGPAELKSLPPRHPRSMVTGRRVTSIVDGTSNSIMVVEAAEAVPWTKPEALECDPQKPLPMLGAVRGGFLALMCDGSVRLFPENAPHASLRLLITINDGMATPMDINAPTQHGR